MISILIPTYNYDVGFLVKQLVDQAYEAGITYEIIVIDDGSHSELNEKNDTLNQLEHCRFYALKENIGRSAMRNLLAKEAQYELLLFLDADTIPKKETFIKNYLDNSHHDVIVGGVTHDEKIPEKQFRLRWLYTKKRESSTGLHSSNFMIKKELFLSSPFDESLTKYGCEDVLFFDALAKKDIRIHEINNPVIHHGNDTAMVFLANSEKAIQNLTHLIEVNKMAPDRYRVSRMYYFLKKARLEKVVATLFMKTRNLLIKNFNSSYPSMLLYDFYRLGYYCKLKTES